MLIYSDLQPNLIWSSAQRSNISKTATTVSYEHQGSHWSLLRVRFAALPQVECSNVSASVLHQLLSRCRIKEACVRLSEQWRSTGYDGRRCHNFNYPRPNSPLLHLVPPSPTTSPSLKSHSIYLQRKVSSAVPTAGPPSSEVQLKLVRHQHFLIPVL